MERTREADPITELGSRTPPASWRRENGNGARDEHAADSSARARAAAPDAWLPVPNVDELPHLEALLDDDRLVRSGQTEALTDTQQMQAVSTAERWAEFRARVPRRSAKSIRRRRLLIVVALALVTGAVVAFLLPALLPGSPQVTIRVDGVRRASVATDAATVRNALREQRVKIVPEDRVTPGLDRKIADGLTVDVVHAFPVTVDIDGAARTVDTAHAHPDALVRQLGLAPDKTSILTAPTRLDSGAFVALRTLREVTIDVDGTQHPERTSAATVGEFLQQNGVVVRPGDELNLPSETRLADGVTVSVVRARADTEQADEPLAPPEIRRDDSSLPDGQTREVQAGAPGVQRVTYEITGTGGRESTRSPISRIPIQPPVSRIVGVGTAAPHTHASSASR